MTKANPPRITILAEDNRTYSFCLKIAMKLGIQKERKKFAPVTIPRSDAGYTWLFREYPEFVRKHRARTTSVAFVVAVDSDKMSHAERVRELDKKLEEAKLEKRKEDEAIVLVIPKRNIETWIMYFSGETVDEKKDYKNKVGKNPNIENAASGFVAEYHEYKKKPENFSTLASLEETYKELGRVMT